MAGYGCGAISDDKSLENSTKRNSIKSLEKNVTSFFFGTVSFYVVGWEYMYFVGKLIRRRPKQCNRSTPTPWSAGERAPWSAQLRERAKSVELLGTELGARRHF